MLRIGKALAVLSLCGLFYKFGHDSAALDHVQIMNEQLTQMRMRYDERLNQLNLANIELTHQVRKYENDNATLNERANNLRMQLATADFNRRSQQTSVDDQPESTRDVSSGRDRAMGAILEEATSLILERDKIALAYNELRSQCQLK